MKEYLRAVCLCMATLVAVLFATGVVWYGYLVAATLFGLTRGETATAILGIALVAGAVKGGGGRRGGPGKGEAAGTERGHRQSDPTMGGAYGKTAV